MNTEMNTANYENETSNGSDKGKNAFSTTYLGLRF